MLYEKKFDKLSSLLTQQPNIINSLRGRNELTLMMYAAHNRQKDCVNYLSKKPHYVSVVDVNGHNVLHFIVCNNDDNAIELLKCLDVSPLNKKIINQQNKLKRTPLHLAAWRNRHKAIRWLCEHGADASLKDYRGKPPYENEFCNEETRSIILQYNLHVHKDVYHENLSMKRPPHVHTTNELLCDYFLLPHNVTVFVCCWFVG